MNATNERTFDRHELNRFSLHLFIYVNYCRKKSIRNPFFFVCNCQVCMIFFRRVTVIIYTFDAVFVSHLSYTSNVRIEQNIYFCESDNEVSSRKKNDIGE